MAAQDFVPATPGSTPVVNQALRALPQPEPMPDLATYERERELCLAADPRRRVNYELYLASRRRGAQVNYVPIKLDIENVSRCNFRCSMCQVSEWPKGKRAEDMSLDAFQRLIDEQYGLVEIKLQGMGEPVLGGDILFAMIRYARARHIWVRTVTNASVLNLHDNYRKLVDSDANEIQISIDGATKNVFESIRNGSYFEKVTANCRLINDYCNSINKIRTKMWTVVQQKNLHQVSDLVDLAAELGFKSQVFSLNLTDWGQSTWKQRNDAVTAENFFDTDTAFSLVEKGRALGVQVAFWNVTSKYSAQSTDRLCPWPFERAYVASDGRVVPCCMIANPDVYQIGRTGDSFGSIWQGSDYEQFRQAHLDGSLPTVCRGCYEQCSPPPSPCSDV